MWSHPRVGGGATAAGLVVGTGKRIGNGERAAQDRSARRQAPQSDAAAPDRFDLDLRLEHELQTALWDGSAGRRRGFSIADGVGAVSGRQRTALLTLGPRTRLRLSSSLKGIGSLAWPAHLRARS
jgi:hypothetical protein